MAWGCTARRGREEDRPGAGEERGRNGKDKNEDTRVERQPDRGGTNKGGGEHKVKSRRRGNGKTETGREADVIQLSQPPHCASWGVVRRGREGWQGQER